MTPEAGFCFRDLLHIVGFVDGIPDVIRKGRELPEIPNQDWNKAQEAFGAHSVPTTFSCQACTQPVFVFKEPKEGAIIQCCQCMAVAHIRGSEGPYDSAEAWEDFRGMYQEERLRPVPEDGMKTDPFTGEPMGLNEKGETWIRNRLGFSSKIDITDDGHNFIYQDSSLSVDPETFERSMLVGKGADFLAMNIAAARVKNGVGPDDIPDAFVIVGDDPDYVWPAGTALDRISPLPYRCPSCKARVRRAPLVWQINMDEIYCCLCACAMFRRDAPRPRSSGEWQELRLTARELGLKHRARLAGNKS